MTAEPIVFTACDAPLVSVVMAVHDAPDWTARSLRALVERTGPCLEVILVDDGSTLAETRALLDEVVRGATVLRPASPVGFGPASNLGVSRARGEFVLFLNTDAIVTAGWLDPLIERLRRSPDVGAVSPMLLNLDGTVQQAGALVSRDGGTAIYGVGGSPTDPSLSFARTIDYGAGACLMVRRSLLEQLGAFDDLFAPAYFEDADLCLRLAANGWRTMYEPRTRVQHAMGASYDAREVAPLATRNRLAFARRWASVLEARPATLDPSRAWTILAARDGPVRFRALVGDHRLATEIAHAFPTARVTSTHAGEPADEVEPLDIAPDEVADLIARRRFHYDVVCLEGNDAAITRWQPQAVRLIGEGPVDALRQAGFTSS